MDKTQLEHLLWNLKPTSESIKKTAEYCSAYPEAVTEIVLTIDDIFVQSLKDRKKILIFLIHEIILDENLKVQQQKSDHIFIKTFGNKLKNIFSEFVNQNDKIADLDQILTVIKRWEKEAIYHPSFIDKLKLIVKPKLDQLKKQADMFNEINQIDSPSQKLLNHNKKLIEENKDSKKVYQFLVEQQKIDDETLKYCSEFDKINLAELDSHKIDTLLEKGESIAQKLQQIIMSNQELQKDMGDMVQHILDIYVKFDISVDLSQFNLESNGKKS